MATTLDPIFTGMANGPETIDKNFKALNNNSNPEFSSAKTIDKPDFNSITKVGIYSLTNVSQGKNTPPTTSWGRLEVYYSGSVGNETCLIQNYYTDSTNYVFTRRLYYSNWTGWSQFASEDTYSADSANGFGSWYGEVHYRRVGRVCTVRFNLKGGSKPTSGDMVSIPDWAIPLNGSVEVAGETTDANVTSLLFANARIDGSAKKLVTSWIAGNVFIAAMTYVCQ